MTGALACLNITVSAGTVTFATVTSPTLDVRGSMLLLTGTIWSSTGTITFSSTTTGQTVTTNGVTLSGSVVFQGSGGEWTLQSALTTFNSLTVNQGTFNTSSVGNYSVTCNDFISSNTTIRTINLNASTINITSGLNTAFNAGTITNLTFNAGTSQININGAPSAGITSGGLTFYNVAFTSTTIGTRAIFGANTFNNLAVTGPSSVGVIAVTFSSQQTINGIFSTTGTAGNRRILFASINQNSALNEVLIINSTPNLTDADFSSLSIIGTAAPISGTRIGNRGLCDNISFNTPKTVYWNLAGSQNWSANGWTNTPTGTPSPDFFPLPQDVATFTNAGSVTGTISLDSAIGYVPTVDMSGRTTSMTLGLSSITNVFGSWINGSGTAFTGTSRLTFANSIIRSITSAGKAFPCDITINAYGSTVELTDALTLFITNNLTVTNGTFDTKGYAVQAGQLSSSNSNLRSIKLGASVLLLYNANPISFSTFTNLTFDAGTSQINAPSIGDVTFDGVGQTFYNVSFTSNNLTSLNITGTNTFNNLTFTSPGGGLRSIYSVLFNANQNINGTLTCETASAVLKIFLQSSTIGTQRTLTANSISATNCDFRDINIAGVASGAAPIRAGDCGGNNGITFPAAKTVYWNLAGVQNWGNNGWALGSGGTPSINNFPLAQDTVVFDNAGSAGTVQFENPWNIGTFDASSRTSAMTLSTSTSNPSVYGDWKFGTGVTSSSGTGTITFLKNGTSTITSNGVQFGCPLNINNPACIVQIADALSLNATRTLTLTAGTFDAVSYNVTTGLFSNTGSSNTLKMGSGTWTLSGTGTILNMAPVPILIPGTSNIFLSSTSTSQRTLEMGLAYYNKLTIGGTTGTSTLTINGTPTLGEIAATKTVAHTIVFSSITVGKWSVTGTVGNVVTIRSPNTGLYNDIAIYGPATTGINYLSVRDTYVFDSPGEFYVGPNSTNVSNNVNVIFTATPAPRTLYWVGGTGNWSSTSSWSTSSGGASGAAIPKSIDAVNFDSLSNATDYTVTIDAGVERARCESFTMAGPLAGNVTFAGTIPLIFHGNVNFAATGITRTYTGLIQFAGNSSYTFTTNGLTLASSITVIGIGSTWTLGSNLSISGITSFTTTCGTFNTSVNNYAINATDCNFISTNVNVRSIIFNASSIVCRSFANQTQTNLTFVAGTSLISLTSNALTLFGSATYYNVSFTNPAATTITFAGLNTFNNLSFAGRTTIGITNIQFNANQTISTLTLNAGTGSAYRTFLRSNTIGTQRTLSVGALTAGAVDCDFRDIVITGAASPLTGTRFGDCKNNSGITFPSSKTVYYGQTGSSNWGSDSAGSWSLTNGGALDDTAFPLAQDAAVFPASTYPASGSTVTINANYNIGTIDMSARTSDTMTLATGTTLPVIYNDWINGVGTTLSGTTAITFAKQSTQNIISSGRTFTQPITVNSPNGFVVLQDNFVTSAAFTLSAGTFNANAYSFSSGTFLSSTAFARTIAFGSAAWTITGTGALAWSAQSSGLTITGSSTINMSNASAKTFAGGGVNYSGITLNQSGLGTLTVSGNNTFKDITSTYSITGATLISFGSTTTRLSQFTATGYSGKILSMSGTNGASWANFILSAGDLSNVDFLSVSFIRAYPVANVWYAGKNSTLSSVLGWVPNTKPVNSGRFFLMFG
jgi:hypothetical protein